MVYYSYFRRLAPWYRLLLSLGWEVLGWTISGVISTSRNQLVESAHPPANLLTVDSWTWTMFVSKKKFDRFHRPTQ